MSDIGALIVLQCFFVKFVMRVLHEGSIQTGALNSSSGDLGVYQSINIKGLTARIIVIPSDLYIYISSK